MPALLFAALLMAAAAPAPAGTLEECVTGTKYDVCTWAQHGAIAGGITLFARESLDMIETPHAALGTALVAAGTCGAFIYRETLGQGGLFDSLDRALDWITPCAVAGSVAGLPVVPLPDGVMIWRRWDW